ncbi:branched-chain amino acid ABC transporter permease [Streptomyces paromomycinus]|uniref:Branched-chain amino acid ABC transporter permease n=2 Tax=Streptomyces paromomycinus TaxID=92743 RepID=A0A401WG50_STREY|nr:branched-chain amino acid ABC transporter permease [Streptomyces paromomycinus]
MPMLPVAMSGPPCPAPTPPPRRRTEALAALKDSASVGLGLLPLGLALGVVIAHAGLPRWCAPLFAAVVYAGSFEFLLVGLTVAAAPLATVALTGFMVNARHVFYALSFPLHRVRGRFGKAYSTFALTDEAYAMTTGGQARSWSGARILSLQAILQVYWVGGATVGALLGSLIPDRVTGLDFAMTALFAVLALDAVAERRGDLPTPVLALLSALAARTVLPGQLLPVAFALFTVGLLVRHLATRKRPSHA